MNLGRASYIQGFLSINWSYYNSSDGTVISSEVELEAFGTESTLILVKPLSLEHI